MESKTIKTKVKQRPKWKSVDFLLLFWYHNGWCGVYVFVEIWRQRNKRLLHGSLHSTFHEGSKWFQFLSQCNVQNVKIHCDLSFFSSDQTNHWTFVNNEQQTVCSIHSNRLISLLSFRTVLFLFLTLLVCVHIDPHLSRSTNEMKAVFSLFLLSNVDLLSWNETKRDKTPFEWLLWF